MILRVMRTHLRKRIPNSEDQPGAAVRCNVGSWARRASEMRFPRTRSSPQGCCIPWWELLFGEAFGLVHLLTDSMTRCEGLGLG
jgi:hypothetical protein